MSLVETGRVLDKRKKQNNKTRLCGFENKLQTHLV